MKLHQRIRREQSRHTDDWLITYADTITLLLCLFVMMLAARPGGLNLTARPAEAEKYVAASANGTVTETIGPVAAFDRALAARFGETPEIGAPDGIAAMPEPPEIAPIAPPIFPDPAALTQPATPEPEVALPVILNRLKSQDTAIDTQQGDRITSLQISSAAFFASGNATISATGKAILRDVAVTLKSDRYAAYDISIEGHTDDAPISTPLFQSNWELSTARAAAVVRFLLELGVPPRKLTAAGYADTFPIAPNRNADGTAIPENQARNRRVVIKLEKIDRAKQ